MSYVHENMLSNERNTRFLYKQPTVLIEPQRCLVFCDFQGSL